MTRVGGGWLLLKDFTDKHGGAEARKLGLDGGGALFLSLPRPSISALCFSLSLSVTLSLSTVSAGAAAYVEMVQRGGSHQSLTGETGDALSMPPSGSAPTVDTVSMSEVRRRARACACVCVCLAAKSVWA